MTFRVAHSLLCFFFLLFVTVHAYDNLLAEALSGFDALVKGDAYSCNKTSPCENGACCGKSGYCGFGDKYCGTTGESPNDACWSNCDAHAECGKDAVPENKGCPLNVCCSPFGFCGTTSEFCGDGCQSGCEQPASNASGSNVQQRIIGYYEAWQSDKRCMGMNVDQVPVESLTHINYAFAVVEPDTFKIGPMPKAEESTISDFTALKERNPNVVVGVSIGGWDFNDNHTETQGVFADIVSSAKKRERFVSELLKFMKHYAFDAVDLDWEYPGATDRQPPHTDTSGNKEGYVRLMRDIRRALDDEDKKYELSFTAPTSYWYLRWFDMKEMVQAADYVNFMTYDLHGIWDATNPIGSHVLAHTNLTEIKDALDLLWRNEVPAKKVNLGLAFYARTFQLKDKDCDRPGCLFKGGGMKGPCTKNSGTLSYRELADVMVSHDITPTYDKKAAVKYFTWNEDQWASFDDQQTFQQKVKFANEQGLGGLLIWSLDQDDSNLDQLRGVLYPQDVKISDTTADDVSFWESQTIGDCQTSDCGGSCSPGTIQIETIDCPSGGDKQKICCPIASAPDPKTCHWRGGESSGFCNGQCHGGEVAISSSVDGGNGHCTDGRQFYCCPIPEVAAGGGINCGWQDTCREDQEPLTFAGTFLLDFIEPARFAGLAGPALSNALEDIDIMSRKMYCCGKEEVENWKDCYWAGKTGRGVHSCDDNHCNTGHEVELTNSPYGGGESCTPMDTSRQRAFCCNPASGESPFMPVPLEYLFPDPPPDDSSPEFTLKVDDTWGTGKSKSKDDPNAAAFGFVVITAPEEVSVSLDKRDGAPWEVMDCIETDSEEEQKVRVLCTDTSEDSLCHKIHLGKGVPGTILQMPESCGPGKYAVAKSFGLSANQSVPGHLFKRGASEVYDLSYDYDFKRVPRDYGESKMRLDFSNEKGYWDAVVDRPGQGAKSKRDLGVYHENPKRWMEEEWRDAYHMGSLSHDEIHKRWFGEDVLAWLANLIGLSEVEATKEFTHSVDERVEVILIDQQFGPCPVGPAQAQANIRSTVDAHLRVDSSFGLTIIANLGDKIDLSQSYLFFRNKGEVDAKFKLDAVASLSYSSGDIKLFGLDDFPGATFRVPGIVTVGPNMAVYASADAEFTVAGHLEAEVAVAQWEIRQTYPENAKYPPDAISKPNNDGTQTLGKPKFEASVTARGEITLHLKPTVQFGIEFDSRWKVDKCTVDLVLDGYTVAHAQASASTNPDNSCPFSYGIDAGSTIFAQLNAPELYGWGGQTQIPIATVPRKQITPETCVKNDSKRSFEDLDPISGDYLSSFSSPDPSIHQMDKRETFTLGPVITIPESFLSCPGNDSSSNSTIYCRACGVKSDDGNNNDDDDGQKPLARRDEGESCPLPGPKTEESCTDSDSLSKRDNTDKTLHLSWQGTFFYSRYPSCSVKNLGSLQNVAKWYMPKGTGIISTCSPEIGKFNADPNGRNTVKGVPMVQFENDHVFEIHLISNFLEWLCEGRVHQYNGQQIPFPSTPGWQRPDPVWCDPVFGWAENTGWRFPVDRNDNYPQNWIVNTATKLGGADRTDLMALYYKNANNAKGKVTAGSQTKIDKVKIDDAIRTIVNTANIFSYLNDNNIKPMWTQPSNDIEAISAAFDAQFWQGTQTDANGDQYQHGPRFPGRELRIPPAPQGVTHWGLRTLWCYWIDRHLAETEIIAASWATTAKTTMDNYKKKGNPQVKGRANQFMRLHMGPGGRATSAHLHYPRNPNGGTSSQSAYGMWGNNNLGNLGI